MAITTVLFDLGGVVCHYDPQPRLEAMAAKSRFDADHIRDALYGKGLTTIWEHGRYNAMQIFLRTREQFKIDVTFDQLADMWVQALRPNPEVLTVIDDVKARARTSMLTDNDALLAEVFAERFPDLAARLDPRFFSCELKAVKPSKELFAAVLEHLDEPAEQVLLVDDNGDNVEGALRCGLDAVQFTDVDALRTALQQRGLVVAS